MTRWEGFFFFVHYNYNFCFILIEAENRLHIMIDILAFIPAKEIQISFMNNRDVTNKYFSFFNSFLFFYFWNRLKSF